MKCILARVVMLIMCWAVCPCQGKVRIVDSTLPQETKPDQWKEFISPEGRFSVLFPGSPVGKISELQTSAGLINSYVYTLKLAESFYYVSYLDYPVYSDDEEWVKKVLDAGRNGMLARNKGTKPLGEKAITLGRFPGREFLTQQDQFSFGVMRAFVVGGRLYEVAILMPVDILFKHGQPSLRPEDRTAFYETVASSFLDSFKIRDPPAETLGEVDRMLRYLKEGRKDVTILTAAADDSTPAKSTAGIINGKAIHLVAPAYPAIARSAHASGQVWVQVVIGLEGKIIAAQVMDGHPLLRVAAIKAARGSEFTAPLINGKPAMLVGVIIYNFVAQ